MQKLQTQVIRLKARDSHPIMFQHLLYWHMFLYKPRGTAIKFFCFFFCFFIYGVCAYWVADMDPVAVIQTEKSLAPTHRRHRLSSNAHLGGGL